MPDTLSDWGDDGAYRAFLDDLNTKARAYFLKERPEAFPWAADYFAEIMAERLDDAFPETRFEAYVRGSIMERENAEHLVYVYADELLGPYSGHNFEGC